MKLNSVIKKAFKISLWALLVSLFVILITNLMVVWVNKQELVFSKKDLSNTKVGLVLGTSKFLTKGGENPFFNKRINAAADLYHSGKVKHLIVSGDNKYQSYNEPRYMYQALIEKGVPHEAITFDFAGFRTLDSVVRAKKIFGQDSIVVITQEFHAYRALQISKKYNIKAQAFAAEEVPLKESFFVRSREVLARTAMYADLYILNTQPEYLGERQPINIGK
ncbi:SanA/YdcF family protein [Mangrovivirga cuniculi]|uniref:SanA protein n=1 Tax=Mangrovivirga cuniculi TaxID=2715131 RepID=A0A4D7K284_9BACT|nr:ElyC/SanA/YdcF family protein [Mangrovivirga cuniculi]QCK14994.1 SanA protein [Mangrovivirga cuniculi]